MTGFLATLLFLPLFLYALLRTTPVQNYVSHRAAAYLSSELGTRIEVGGVDVSWFFNLVVTDVKVLDKHSNCLLSFHRLKARVEKLSLKKRELVFRKITLNQADIQLITYKNDSSLNLQFILDYFASSDTTSSVTKPWKLSCQGLEISASHFALRDENSLNPGPGIDFSDLDLHNLDMDLHDIQLKGDTIQAEIRNISATEKSGFDLRHFSALASVSSGSFSADSLQIITANSDLSLDLRMDYGNWGGFINFLDSVNIRARFKPSELDMRDLVFFAPDIRGMEEKFDLAGNLKGTVSSFTGKEMVIAYGNGTRFAGTIKMAGLPDFENTFIHLDIDEFRTDVPDIEQFSLPGSTDRFKVPAEVSRLGSIIVKGKFTGFYNDFVSNATFLTDAGNIATDILLSNNRKEKIIKYNGHIQASEFNVGKVFDLREFGTLNLDATIDGKGFKASNADFTVKGDFTSLQFLGNSLNHVTLDGGFNNSRFQGLVDVTDDLARLHFNGSVDLSDSLPAFDFTADLKNAKLTRLNLLDRDSSSMLSTHMNLNFKGNTLDNLLGSMQFLNTVFVEKNQRLSMKKLNLEMALENGGKRMTLVSDFADASFTGQYTFDDLSEYLTFIFTDYLPALSLVKPSLPRDVKGRFDYTIQLKNTDPVSAIFVPGLSIDPNTVISGGFDPSSGQVNVNGKSSLIQFAGFSFRDWVLNGASKNGEFGLTMQCGTLDHSSKRKPDIATTRLERFKLSTTARNDSVLFRFFWDDRDSVDLNKADFGGSVSFSSYPRLLVHVNPATLLINDTLWSIAEGNSLCIDSASMEIRGLQFSSRDQRISINGRVSHDPLDVLNLEFNQFNVSQLDMLTQPIGIDFDGFLSGRLSVSDLYEVPLVTASLRVEKLGFNHEFLGDAEISSNWDNKSRAINLDTRIAYLGNAGLHYPLLAKGVIYPERDHDNFDVDIKVDNIKLKALQPFFTGLFSRMKGLGSGNLTLTGDFSDPVLAGSVNLMRSEMMVDYLRTTYSFTGIFNFDKDLMWFKDLQLADSLGNTGTASGKIKHQAFSDWYLDIQVNANKLSVLNTAYNPDEYYYGKVRATGSVSLTGPVNDLTLLVKATSEKGTEVFVPINYSVNISGNDYITYETADTAKSGLPAVPPVPSNINLQLGLDVTRNAYLEIILPYRMGNIKVKGDGLINMGIDSRGDYSMHGQYVMDKGSFLFNFQDLFNRTFEIQKGSTITFNGSPDDADINLQAVYKIKTTLSGLSGVPSDYASKRIPVDCIISLKNSLYNPDIHFSIGLGEADVETQRMVYSSIDTANSVAMNQQMISLLVLNSFTSSGESSTVSATDLGFSTMGILSNQINSWLSQISKDLDIGVKYRAGNQLSPQEVEVALSTQLFNDRVVIDGTVGRSSSINSSGTSGSTGTQNTNQWIGDVNMEVKITEDGRFRVRAFNRTNTSIDLFTGQSPYTQGVGILYRKDFDNIGDLFHKQHKSIITE